ncbi:hypothetical protein Tco_1555070 [Tanacetum coccineum]
MATTLPLKDSLGGVGSLRGVGENFEEVVPNSLSVNCLTNGCGLLGKGCMILNLLDKGCLSRLSSSSESYLVVVRSTKSFSGL